MVMFSLLGFILEGKNNAQVKMKNYIGQCDKVEWHHIKFIWEL